MRPFLLATLVLLPLAGCSGDFSPDTYSTRAVQQANKVEQGVIVGTRRINIVSGGEAGTAAGGAAGAVLGSQAPSGIFSALGGVGGALIGGIAGSAVEHGLVDNIAWEYVVRIAGKPDLVSVTQRDERPMELGQRVLVIAGPQARIVPDYTQPLPNQAGAQAAGSPARPVPVPPPAAPEPVIAGAPGWAPLAPPLPDPAPAAPAPVAVPPATPGS